MHITYMHIVFIMSYKLINILLLLLASIIIIYIYMCVYMYIYYTIEYEYVWVILLILCKILTSLVRARSMHNIMHNMHS